MLKKLQSQNFGQNPAIKSQPNFSLNIYFWKVLSPLRNSVYIVMEIKVRMFSGLTFLLKIY